MNIYMTTTDYDICEDGMSKVQILKKYWWTIFDLNTVPNSSNTSKISVRNWQNICPLYRLLWSPTGPGLCNPTCDGVYSPSAEQGVLMNAALTQLLLQQIP